MPPPNKIWLILSSFLLSGMSLFAQEEPAFPTPSGIANQLFYLQRSPNSNTVIYELNYKNGELDSLNPIHVFWLRYTEQGQREELSAVQRKFAYGIQTRRVAPDQYEFHFLAYKKRSLYLKKGADGKYQVFTEVNDKHIIVSRIYLKINGGPVFKPNIEYVEFRGLDTDTGQPIEERVKV